MKISNPVLTGFHADPSMIRVGDTYYISTHGFHSGNVCKNWFGYFTWFSRNN